jgi:membrane protein YdbS with pleckstrin-like domain
MDDWTRLRLLAPKWWWYVSAPGWWAAVVFVALAYVVMIAVIVWPLCRAVKDGQRRLDVFRYERKEMRR